MGSGVTNFLSVIEARSLGTADVDKMAAAIDKQTAALEGLGQKATKVNEHPGFSAFAEKVKQGISDPLGAAGSMAEGFLTKLGPMGAGIAASIATLGAFAKVSTDAARDLGKLGDEIEDTASRMGLTTHETQVFGLAMKMVGGDMGSLEGTMRKLSSEIEDGGKNLQKLGVNFRDTTTGGVLPMSGVLLQLAERLGQIPSVTERNTAAVKILGRSALQVLPDLLALPEALERAGRSGLVFTDQTLKGFSKLQEEMALVDAKWDFIVAKMKEGVTIPLMWVIGGDIDKAPKGTFGSANFPLNFAGGGKYAGASPEFRAKAEAADREANEKGAAAAKADAELDERVRAHVKKLNEERKAWFELREEVDRFAKAMGNKQMNPIEQMFAQRDELLGKGANRSEVTGLAIRGALPELAKGWADTDKQTLSVFQRSGEMNGKPYLEWAKEQIEGLERGSAAVVKNFSDWEKKSKDVADAINDIEVNSNRSEIMARSGKQLGLANSRFGPGQEGQSIAFAYQERLRLANELYDFEWSHAKTLIDQEKAFADWKRAKQDAEIEHEVRLAELQRRRIEEFRGEMGGLFDALMGGKDGLQQFAMGQARNVGRAVFSNTMTSLATGSGITRQSTFAGAGLLGDMLGGQSNPLKAATDTNTMATVENTRAMMAFSARMATSASGGGGGFAGAARSLSGGFSSGGWPTSGTAGDTGYTSDGVPRYSSENYDDYGVFLGAGGAGGHDPSAVGASARGGGGFNASKAAGYGASAAGVGFGIYGIAKSPSTKGKLASGGAALMSVAPLTGPAAPFVAAAGMALEVFSAFMKDPKQVRAEELDRERKSRAFNMPTGYEYEVDTSGRSYDHDYTGRLRPIINITNNVQTFDPQNFQDYLVQNPDAVSKGVSNAIYNDGGQITASMSQVLA